MTPAGTPQKLIFVIDDEQVIARTLAIILQRAGYRTEFFSSAEDALGAATLRLPDLIVTDVVLDGMSGLQLAEKVAQACPKLPVILISGQAQTARLAEESEERGFHFHVHPKPMLPAVLLGKVAELLAVATSPCDRALAA